MRDLKIGSLQWAVGVYCAIVGALMLVAPQQFAAPAYAGMRPYLGGLGALFLAAGCLLFASAVLVPPRPVVVAAHLSAAAGLMALAAPLALAGAWTGGLTYGMLALGAAAAAATCRPRHRPPGAESRTLLALVVGLALVLAGLLMLLAPEQYSGPQFRGVRDRLSWYGIAFVAGGLALVTVQMRAGLPRPVVWAAHLTAAGVMFAWLLAVQAPARQWTGMLYWGGFGALVALLPWLGQHLRAVGPTSLRTRLALALVAATAFPAVVVIGIGSDRAERAATTDSLRHQQAQAALFGEEVAGYMRLHRGAVAALAAQPGLRTPDPAAHTAILRAFAGAYPDVTAFSTHTVDGEPVARSDDRPLASAVGSPAYEATRRTGAPALDVRVGRVIQQPAFLMTAPIRGDDGRLLGVAFAAVESARLATYLARASEAVQSYAYLVDDQGRALAHPDAALVASLADLTALPPVAALSATTVDHGSLEYRAPSGSRIAGYARIPELGWSVVSEEPKGTALASIYAERELAFAALLAACVLAAAVGVLLAGWLVAPLATLARVADRLAVGDYRPPLPRTNVAEVAHLTVALGAMRDRIAVRTAERDHADTAVRALNATLEARVAQRTEQLQVAISELEAFAYSVSHDLRAPLRAIDGFCRTLRRKHAEALPPEAQRYLGIIADNAVQMGRLIDDLLAFSRLSRQPLHKQPVEPAALVEQALAELQADQDGRTVAVTVEPLPVCQAEPAMLKQVYVNLLTNALKFTRQRARAEIVVGSEEQGGRRVYFVRDNGAGFDMRYVDKLFGVFQRLHAPEEYEGTGVGLAIVQRIVHRHGGRVWATGAVEQGATFYFTLNGSN